MSDWEEERYKILGKTSENLKKLILKYGGKIVEKEHTLLVCSKEDLKMDKEFYLQFIHGITKIYDKIKFEKYLEEFDVLDQNPTKDDYIVNDLWGIQYDSDFPCYYERRYTRKMDCIVYEKNIDSYIIDVIPFDVLLQIFSFFDLETYLSTRLLCKKLANYDNEYWKYLCSTTIKQNPWMPQVSIEKMNVKKQHWFQYYRESIHPLLIDKKILINYLKFYQIDEKKVKLEDIFKCGIFMDSRRCKSDVNIGKSKIGGLPHLSKNMKWPLHSNFVAQINLEDLTPFLSFQDLPLPRKGILYFFEDFQKGSVLFYDEDISNLLITDAPEWFKNNLIYPIQDLIFYEAISKISEDKLKKILPFVVTNAVNLPAEYERDYPSYHCLFGNLDIQDEETLTEEDLVLLHLNHPKINDNKYQNIRYLIYSLNIKDKNVLKDPKKWKVEVSKQTCWTL